MAVVEGTFRVAHIGNGRRSRGKDTATDPPGIAALFDHVRALEHAGTTRAVVFSPAVRAVNCAKVTGGLAAHAERRGLASRVAELREGEDGVVLTMGNGDRGLALEPMDGPAPADLDGWLARVAPRAGLVIIQAPPLSESIAGALLARACDGLLIVAEMERTPREELRVAADRARLAGCALVGVVMVAGPERAPAWFRRLMGGG
jgi:hypothetical protein